MRRLRPDDGGDRRLDGDERSRPPRGDGGPWPAPRRGAIARGARRADRDPLAAALMRFTLSSPPRAWRRENFFQDVIRDSGDQIARRFRQRRRRRVEAKAIDGRIDNFLTGLLGHDSVFQNDAEDYSRFSGRSNDRASAARREGLRESKMAAQAIGIAQNGLGSGGRSVRGKRESIRRISY